MILLQLECWSMESYIGDNRPLLRGIGGPFGASIHAHIYRAFTGGKASVYAIFVGLLETLYENLLF